MNKICRIKFRREHKVTIFDIFILSKMCEHDHKVLVYIDDRDSNAIQVQKIINDLLHGLETFEIKHNCIFIRFTDYFDTADAYLHRLIIAGSVVLNYNTYTKKSDLNTFVKHKKCKIILKDNIAISNFCDIYANILYDDGWYRDILIEAIIDYSEDVTMIVATEEGDKKMVDQKAKLHIELCRHLGYKVPIQTLDIIITAKKNYEIKYNTVKKTDKINGLIDFTYRQLLRANIKMSTIENMIINGIVELKIS